MELRQAAPLLRRDYMKYSIRMEKYKKKWPQFRSSYSDQIVKKAVRSTRCPYCHEGQFKIKFEKPDRIHQERMEGPNGSLQTRSEAAWSGSPGGRRCPHGAGPRRSARPIGCY
jgi:hypothetical protein